MQPASKHEPVCGFFPSVKWSWLLCLFRFYLRCLVKAFRVDLALSPTTPSRHQMQHWPGWMGARPRKGKGSDGKGRKRKESLDVADCPPDWKQRCWASGNDKGLGNVWNCSYCCVAGSITACGGLWWVGCLASVKSLLASMASCFDWMPMTSDPHVSGMAILFSCKIL